MEAATEGSLSNEVPTTVICGMKIASVFASASQVSKKRDSSKFKHHKTRSYAFFLRGVGFAAPDPPFKLAAIAACPQASFKRLSQVGRCPGLQR